MRLRALVLALLVVLLAGLTAAPSGAREDRDPRWRFYSSDHRLHTSPWFAGRHRVMIGYG